MGEIIYNICLTEEEIKNNPNYYDLGELVFEKYLKNNDNSELNVSFFNKKIVCRVCDKDLGDLNYGEKINCDDPRCKVLFI